MSIERQTKSTKQDQHKEKQKTYKLCIEVKQNRLRIFELLISNMLAVAKLSIFLYQVEISWLGSDEVFFC